MSEGKPYIKAGDEADAHRRARALWLVSEAASFRTKRAIKGTEKCGVCGRGAPITGLHSGVELDLQHLTDEISARVINEHHHG